MMALCKDGIVYDMVQDDYSPEPGFYLLLPEQASGLPRYYQPRATEAWPFDFLSRITNDELTQIQLSTDANVIRFRTMIQTMVSPVQLDDQQTIQGLGYLTYIGILAPGRAEQIRGLS